LTREGFQFAFLLLFVLIAAMLQSINMLVLMAGAFSAMLLLQWRLCSRTLSEISADRVLPTRIQARKPFHVQIVLTNPRWLLGSWLVMIRERLRPKDTTLGPGAKEFGITLMLDRLLPKSSQSVTYQCLVPARGSYGFADLEISTRFPMSLMRGFRFLPTAESILVHPTQGTVAQNWRDVLKLPVQGRLRRRTSRAGGDDEFFGLRDYRAGDPVRHIHWRTSAKRGELVIRQFEREENRAIGVVLDLYRQVGKGPTEQAWLELAIELTASLIAKVVTGDRSVATLAMVSDQRPSVARIQTANQLNAALDRLALVRSPTRDPLLSMLHQTLRYTGGRDPIIVVSTRTKSEFLNSLSASRLEQQTTQADDASAIAFAAEGRMVWLDVARDSLEHIFVQG